MCTQCFHKAKRADDDHPPGLPPKRYVAAWICHASLLCAFHGWQGHPGSCRAGFDMIQLFT